MAAEADEEITDARSTSPTAIVLVTTLAQAIATSAILALSTIAPIVAADLGVAADLIGYQVSTVYLVATLTSSVAAVIIARWGPAGTTQILVFILAAGLLLIATADLLTIALGSAMLGVSYGLTNPSASELLARFTSPARRNLFFSIKQTGVPIGASVTGLVIPVLAVTLGWQAALAALAATAFAAGIALSFFRPVPRAPAPAKATASAPPRFFADLAHDRRLLGLSLMGFLYTAAQIALAAFLVTMLVDEFGWNPVDAGTASAIFYAAGAIGRIFWGSVADRTKRGAAVLGFLGLLTTAGWLMFVYSEQLSTAWTISLLALVGASSFGWNGIMLAQVVRLAPEGQIAYATGRVMTLAFSGAILGPALFSITYGLLGSYTATYALFSLAALIGAAVIFLTQRQQ